MDRDLFDLMALLLFGVPASLIDIRTKTIPDLLSLGGIVTVFLLKTSLFGIPFWVSLLNVAAGILLFGLVRIISRGKLGWGDVKWSGFLCLVTGFFRWTEGVGLAVLLVLLYYVVSLAASGVDKNAKIPFCPFLTLGAIFRVTIGMIK